MNAEQKKRIAHEISNWRNAAQGGIEDFKSTGKRMAALLQELIDAPAAAPADLVQDSVASEPVGYLYTNLQSGEYHVSDTDDDYRGPERVLWCIETVYRRTKGQQA